MAEISWLAPYVFSLRDVRGLLIDWLDLRSLGKLSQTNRAFRDQLKADSKFQTGQGLVRNYWAITSLTTLIASYPKRHIYWYLQFHPHLELHLVLVNDKIINGDHLELLLVILSTQKLFDLHQEDDYLFPVAAGGGAIKILTWWLASHPVSSTTLNLAIGQAIAGNRLACFQLLLGHVDSSHYSGIYDIAVAENRPDMAAFLQDLLPKN